MPVPLDFLKHAWAVQGDRQNFPYNPDTIRQMMSWIEGFTHLYQTIPEEGGVYIERKEFNQILYLLTKQIIDAFAITASDEQLNTEIAERQAADADLQHQLDIKFMNVGDISISPGVTYIADISGLICVDLEWGTAGTFQSPGPIYMNAELICSHGANPQYVFATPYAWKDNSGSGAEDAGARAITTPQSVPGGARPNMTLVTTIENGDTYQLVCETANGLNGSSGIRVKSAKILY